MPAHDQAKRGLDFYYLSNSEVNGSLREAALYWPNADATLEL